MGKQVWEMYSLEVIMIFSKKGTNHPLWGQWNLVSNLSKPGYSIFGMLITNQMTISKHFKPQCKYGTSFGDINIWK